MSAKLATKQLLIDRPFGQVTEHHCPFKPGRVGTLGEKRPSCRGAEETNEREILVRWEENRAEFVVREAGDEGAELRGLGLVAARDEFALAGDDFRHFGESLYLREK